MRDIKFRIIHNGKIVGYERLTETGWKWNWIELNPDKGERWSTGVIQDSTPKAMLRNQYTGLKDKNGTEIYFDDLVKAPSGLILRVIWYEDEIRIALESKDTIYNFNVGLYEVIGNVHLNPEML